MIDRPYSTAQTKLRSAGLRLTKQRLALGRLLFDGPNRHVTAESFHEEALEQGVQVSLATIYNTLHQFTDAGLLRQVIVDGSKIYFDTNVSEHHHFYLENQDQLMDIDAHSVQVTQLPSAPKGTEVTRVDVIVRLRDKT